MQIQNIQLQRSDHATVIMQSHDVIIFSAFGVCIALGLTSTSQTYQSGPPLTGQMTIQIGWHLGWPIRWPFPRHAPVPHIDQICQNLSGSLAGKLSRWEAWRSQHNKRSVRQ